MMRPALSVLLAVLLAWPAVGQGAGQPPSIPRDTPYAAARERLVAAGYIPLRFPGGEWRERCFSRIEICQAYGETESCAGTGFAECLFVFADPRGGFLEVTTRGEELRQLQVQRIARAGAEASRQYRVYASRR